MMEDITIIGGGLVGSLLSIYWAQAGFKVNLYERRSDVKPKHIPSGRSVNITLCERGFRVLNEVGIGESIRKRCIPLTGRVIHELNQDATYHPYGNRQEAIYAIQRNELSDALLNFAQAYPNIDIKFNQKCIDIDLPTTTLTLQNTQTNEVSQIKVDRVFAADGAFSTIRQVMSRQKRFNYSQFYHDQGYKEIVISPPKKYLNLVILLTKMLFMCGLGEILCC